MSTQTAFNGVFLCEVSAQMRKRTRARLESASWGPAGEGLKVDTVSEFEDPGSNRVTFEVRFTAFDPLDGDLKANLRKRGGFWSMIRRLTRVAEGQFTQPDRDKGSGTTVTNVRGFIVTRER